mmetsp:Transcript_59311/g.167033  ORF Transcript_59311/g.167033 Transcript_59311/m.167033 type:complete len:439 (+) Transcript_59311:885-2201(+)
MEEHGEIGFERVYGGAGRKQHPLPYLAAAASKSRTAFSSSSAPPGAARYHTYMPSAVRQSIASARTSSRSPASSVYMRHRAGPMSSCTPSVRHSSTCRRNHWRRSMHGVLVPPHEAMIAESRSKCTELPASAWSDAAPSPCRAPRMEFAVKRWNAASSPEPAASTASTAPRSRSRGPLRAELGARCLRLPSTVRPLTRESQALKRRTSSRGCAPPGLSMLPPWAPPAPHRTVARSSKDSFACGKTQVSPLAMYWSKKSLVLSPWGTMERGTAASSVEASAAPVVAKPTRTCMASKASPLRASASTSSWPPPAGPDRWRSCGSSCRSLILNVPPDCGCATGSATSLPRRLARKEKARLKAWGADDVSSRTSASPPWGSSTSSKTPRYGAASLMSLSGAAQGGELAPPDRAAPPGCASVMAKFASSNCGGSGIAGCASWE